VNHRAQGSHDEHGPIKCLVVDDQEDYLFALCAVLRQEGVELLTARSGSEALEALLAHDVALAILDVHMPEMDGFELAELMRGSERTRHVPLIFVTGASRDQHRQFRGYESGAVDFLHKPVDPHVLVSKADVFFRLHRQQRQLARQLAERTETLRIQELFTAALGHDLRNPLNAILAGAELIRMASRDAEIVDTSQRVLASARRMARMVNDMMDLSRARLAGGIPIHPSPTDVAAVARRVLGEVRSGAPDAVVELVGRGDLSGHWDTERLAQVLSNLVSNALEHGRAGGPVLVELDGTDAAYLRLSVSNDGEIDASLRNRLFDPFRTTRGKSGQGLGLGLYIVQQIARAHGGDVSFDGSTPGRVSLRVTLPRNAPS
jgi:two-component system, sensor histidine kinase and response regulator